MRNNIENNESEGEAIIVGRSEVGKLGQSVGAAPDLSVADAEMPSLDEEAPSPDRNSEMGWNMVTRRQSKAQSGSAPGRIAKRGRPAKAVVIRTAEDGMAAELRRNREELTQLRELVKTLTKMVEAVQASQEESKAYQIKAHTYQVENQKENEKQTKKIELLQGVVGKEVQKPSYSEALRGRTGPSPAQPTRPGGGSPESQSTQSGYEGTPPRPRDGRVVAIDTIATEYKDIQDLALVKESLQQSIDGHRAMQGAKVQCLRPLGTRGLDVVFETMSQADKAKEHPQWVSRALPGARLKRDTWYPVKCDGIAKQIVLDETAKDGRTLRPGILATFKNENSTEEVDCTAMKASWLSRNYPNKAVGSMVIYLKAKRAADYLLRLGSVIFGPAGATCSHFERLENDGPCYNCNKYGHKQNNCRRKVCCGKCSGEHNTRVCDNTQPKKCPSCGGPHTIFDKRCPQHPRYRKETSPAREDGNVEVSISPAEGPRAKGGDERQPSETAQPTAMDRIRFYKPQTVRGNGSPQRTKSARKQSETMRPETIEVEMKDSDTM
jgi:hypothetical protein